jgi:hypothetical protein
MVAGSLAGVQDGGAPRLGIEPFDVGYGAAFAVDDESPFAEECEVVEDGGELTAHDPAPRPAPDAVAFVDGTRRVDARLSRTDAAGTVTGVAGSIAAGAVVRPAGGPLRFEHVAVRRYAICGGGHRVELPPQPGGWSWEPDSVAADGYDAVEQRLQRHMRAAEVAIAERLCAAGMLTVLDGPLTMVRSGWDTPVVGYVKTHLCPKLAPDAWARVPTIGVGQRTSTFAMRDLYAAYLRVGDPGPWSSPWGGIVRLEVPAGTGLERAVAAIDAAAAWLPRFASPAHRDPRAPVNLQPVAGLEAHLRHLQGDAGLAQRAVRAAVVGLNSGESA